MRLLPVRSCVRIPRTNCFYFPTRKYFTLSYLFIFLFEFLDFLRSLDRFKVLIRAIFSEFYMPWRKISLKYLLINGGMFVPHFQTVSTSLMPRLVNKNQLLGHYVWSYLYSFIWCSPEIFEWSQKSMENWFNWQISYLGIFYLQSCQHFARTYLSKKEK